MIVEAAPATLCTLSALSIVVWVSLEVPGQTRIMSPSADAVTADWIVV